MSKWALAGLVCVLVCCFLSVPLLAQPVPAALQPQLDQQGRFIIYGEKRAENEQWEPLKGPFIPCGWMPKEVESLLDAQKTTLLCPDKPAEGGVCWMVRLKAWALPRWCGIAWFTHEGWEPTAEWPAYDLSGATKLVFWARGAEGDEVISSVKIGILNDKGPYGDKTLFPIATRPIRLSTEWAKIEIPLQKAVAAKMDNDKLLITPDDYGPRLKRIVNPFTLILSQDVQVDERPSMTIYLDNIYYQIGEERPASEG